MSLQSAKQKTVKGVTSIFKPFVLQTKHPTNKNNMSLYAPFDQHVTVNKEGVPVFFFYFNILPYIALPCKSEMQL